jgi:hypothetical protein
VTEATDVAPLERRPVALGTILHDSHVVVRRDAHNLMHGRRKSMEMHGHDCCGPSTDRGRQQRRIHAPGSSIYVDENRNRAGILDRDRGCGRRQRNGDDLITGPDAECDERKAKRIGSRRHANNLCHVQISCKVGFERSNFLAEDEGTAVEDPADSG